MINFHLQSTELLVFPQLKTLSMQQGLEACEFCAIAFQTAINWSVAISSVERDQAFPTIHFQRCEQGMFLQFFAADTWSVDGEEGWFTLSMLPNVSTEDPVIASDLYETERQYFRALFADGVHFSKHYLCSDEMVVSVLKKMKHSEPEAWFGHGNWQNLGLI